MAIMGNTIRRVTALLGLCLMVSCAADPIPITRQQAGWPGLPPDCWTEPRGYQTDGDDWDWPSKTVIERVALVVPEAVTTSPNGVYYFALTDLSSSPRRSVAVFSEKEHLVRISFADSIGLDVQWINERLLYMRAMWGRVAATDMIFDVEKEKFIHTESYHFGANAFEQYREGCALHGGCKCIQKVPQ
jgi:hypothetical protein